MREKLSVPSFEEERKLDKAVEVLVQKIDPMSEEQRLIFGFFSIHGSVTNLDADKLVGYLSKEGIFASELDIRMNAEKIAKRYTERTGYHMNG